MIEWSTPQMGDDFEHDIDGGLGGTVLVLSSMVLLWVLLLVWLPEGVRVPWWLWAFEVVLIAFFPVRWLLRRPYVIVAETQDLNDLPGERWTGIVRGRGNAREEVRVVVRSLRTRATPGYADGPLQPVI